MGARERMRDSLRARRGLSEAVATQIVDAIALLNSRGVKAAVTVDGGQIGFEALVRGQLRSIRVPPSRAGEVVTALLRAVSDSSA